MPLVSDIVTVEDEEEKEFHNEYKQLYYKNASIVKMAAERIKRQVC